MTAVIIMHFFKFGISFDYRLFFCSMESKALILSNQIKTSLHKQTNKSFQTTLLLFLNPHDSKMWGFTFFSPMYYTWTDFHEMKPSNPQTMPCCSLSVNCFYRASKTKGISQTSCLSSLPWKADYYGDYAFANYSSFSESPPTVTLLKSLKRPQVLSLWNMGSDSLEFS